MIKYANSSFSKTLSTRNRFFINSIKESPLFSIPELLERLSKFDKERNTYQVSEPRDFYQKNEEEGFSWSNIFGGNKKINPYEHYLEKIKKETRTEVI